MTTYIVFRKQKVFVEAKIEDGAWVDIGSAAARSAGSAIREVLIGLDDANGEYVAVPARSWQPVKVQVETALKFS